MIIYLLSNFNCVDNCSRIISDKNGSWLFIFSFMKTCKLDKHDI